MNGYTVAIVASAFAPAMACIGAAIRLALDDDEYAGFGWSGFVLGIGALMLASQVIAKSLP